LTSTDFIFGRPDARECSPQPDHATIARFIERHESALAGLFGEALWLCADAGLAPHARRQSRVGGGDEVDGREVDRSVASSINRASNAIVCGYADS
jgi:hypothetical protein